MSEKKLGFCECNVKTQIFGRYSKSRCVVTMLSIRYQSIREDVRSWSYLACVCLEEVIWVWNRFNTSSCRCCTHSLGTTSLDCSNECLEEALWSRLTLSGAEGSVEVDGHMQFLEDNQFFKQRLANGGRYIWAWNSCRV